MAMKLNKRMFLSHLEGLEPIEEQRIDLVGSNHILLNGVTLPSRTFIDQTLSHKESAETSVHRVEGV